jgi:hypothetical protein
MARCSCAGSSCNCTVQAADGLAIKGTGNNADPYIITFDTTTLDQDLVFAGPIDLSGAVFGSIGTIGLAEDADDVILPVTSHGHVQLLIRQDGTGNTVTWPSNVKWPGGAAPVLSTTPGNIDWIDLRQVGDVWVGRLVAAEIG